MLLEKEHDDNLWKYEESKSKNNVFTVEVKSNGRDYFFEVYHKFPNQFDIIVYYLRPYQNNKIYCYKLDYKRFDYLLNKLKQLIDCHSNGQLIRTILHSVEYVDLCQHLKYLNEAMLEE